jgi:hypothetical protein
VVSTHLAPATRLFNFTAVISNYCLSQCHKMFPSIASGISHLPPSVATISRATKASRCWWSIRRMLVPILWRGARPMSAKDDTNLALATERASIVGADNIATVSYRALNKLVLDFCHLR